MAGAAATFDPIIFFVRVLLCMILSPDSAAYLVGYGRTSLVAAAAPCSPMPAGRTLVFVSSRAPCTSGVDPGTTSCELRAVANPNRNGILIFSPVATAFL
jgi:hypothetical protein